MGTYIIIGTFAIMIVGFYAFMHIQAKLSDIMNTLSASLLHRKQYEQLFSDLADVAKNTDEIAVILVKFLAGLKPANDIEKVHAKIAKKEKSVIKKKKVLDSVKINTDKTNV